MFIQNKTRILFLALLFILPQISFSKSKTEKPAPAATETTATLSVDLNDAKNLVKWKGTKVIGSKHEGTLKLLKADLKVNAKGEIMEGSQFEIDMNSLQVTDKDMDDASKKKLTGHLSSDDFFSVKTHPKAQFVIKKITPAPDKKLKTTHTVEGELTIKNITQTISFPATITKNGKETNIAAEVKVDRTKFNITFKSGSIVKDLAQNTIISDEFVVTLNLTAK